MVKLSRQKDCGKSPKKFLLEELTSALATGIAAQVSG
jgi:hypothetical protein